MAVVAIAANLANGAYDARPVRDSANSYAAVDAAIVVLVADGASPTQPHVTTLNNAWGPFKTEVAVPHMLVQFDNVVLDTVDKKVKALVAIAKAMGLPGE